MCPTMSPCPACGSSDGPRSLRSRNSALGAAAPDRECRSCGHQWDSRFSAYRSYVGHDKILSVAWNPCGLPPRLPPFRIEAQVIAPPQAPPYVETAFLMEDGKRPPIRYTPLDRDELELHRERLASLNVPAHPISPLVCDGEYVEVTIEGNFARLTIGYWTIAPAGYEVIAEIAYWVEAKTRKDARAVVKRSQPARDVGAG